MNEERAVSREVAKRYQRAGKKEKGRILGEFIQMVGYTRCYASYILRNWGEEDRAKGKGGDNLGRR
ncbi:hypothetical protein LR013_04510 [candidate division NPL-UPA2 bacterium]|nr:hypothetical protein [candidate division NPL-UPA2 bacterium]